MAVPELIKQAVYAREVGRSDRKVDGVALGLQLVLEVVVPCAVGESHIGVLAADPFDGAQREFGLLDASAVDPTLVTVAQHPAPADVAGRDYGNRRTIALLSETDWEGPFSDWQHR